MKSPLQSAAEIVDFFREGVWRIRLKDLNIIRRFLIKYLRVIIIAAKEFVYDKCPLRASALTYYSLLSVVPVAAMGFAIAKGFRLQTLLEEQLMEKFSGQEVMVMQIIEFSRNMLKNTKGGIIAGVGVVVLLWAVINVLSQIEDTFNDISGVEKSRSFGRKFSDYLSLFLIGPLLLIMSSSAMVLISTHLPQITQKIALLGIFSPLVAIVIKVLPYCFIWILFTFIYIFMPNQKVPFFSGLIAGIVAGTIFVIVQKLYIFFQIGVAKYNTIYGSFAALPLFLLWMQLSWFIMLFGAEISFAHQNVDAYEFEPDRKKISPLFRKLLSLQITHMLVINFIRGENPMTVKQICNALDIPIRLVQEILNELVGCGLLSDTTSENNCGTAYQPARDINDFSISFIINALENNGIDTIPTAQTDSFKSLSSRLKNFAEIIEKSPSNTLLKNI
ncbi:MAG: YihY family inner membrane protein [Desulfobacterium sp.]|nr:YihY family inner membrane protein [Desulfobacterium sp.]MBU3946749.1 YihY family inner membrane protein [Pseudomonadota bacterium]MBU4034908.1 YihY family inner membrane protein [Pseudomonadota bacterium]